MIVLRTGRGKPEASPFTSPVGGSYGDQSVMFTPFTSRRFRSRKLMRSAGHRGLSPIASPTSFTVRSMTCAQARVALKVERESKTAEREAKAA